MRFPADEQRFWARMARVGKCLEWQGARTGAGYGNVAVRDGSSLRNTQAHRIAWVLKNGPIPTGQFVLHKCDNRSCCDPNHLFLGDWRANALDMIAKKRHGWDRQREAMLVGARKRGVARRGKPTGTKYRGPRGELHGNAKLTDAQVAEILARWVPHKGNGKSRGYVSQVDLAAEYGVSVSLIEKLVRGVLRRQTV